MARTRIGGLIAAQTLAQRPRLRLAAAGGVVVTVAAVCLLGLSGWFITGAAIAGLAGGAVVQAFNYLMPSAVIRLLAILRTGGRYVERVAGHEAALKALARLRPQLFDAMGSGPAETALVLSSGEVSARLVQDVDAIQTLFVRRSAPWALGAGTAAAVILAGMATPAAGLVLLIAVIAACGGGVLIARTLADPAGRAAQTAVADLKDRLSALEAVAPELRAYDLDSWAVAQVQAAAAQRDDALAALARIGGWMAAWQACCTAMAVVAVVPATAGAALPMTALAVLAAVMGIEAAAGLTTALHQKGAATAALDRLDSLIPVESIRAGAVRPAALAADAIIGLTGMDQTLAPPLRLGVLGASGAGKTTLVERLIGLRPALAGEAMIAGRDAAGVPQQSRRELFAYAAQDVRLLGGSIRQNLLLAGPAEDAALWRALDDAGLGDRVRADPRGLDAPVGPNGERLSGGERRRLGLARAYLRDAPWLVLDEPTEGLDAATAARVLDALDRRLSERGQGLILISHQARPMDLCDQVIRVQGMADDGRVIVQGQRRSAA